MSWYRGSYVPEPRWIERLKAVIDSAWRALRRPDDWEPDEVNRRSAP
jgi:hypothetical protein